VAGEKQAARRVLSNVGLGLPTKVTAALLTALANDVPWQNSRGGNPWVWPMSLWLDYNRRTDL
jgi:hypothetical protein